MSATPPIRLLVLSPIPEEGAGCRSASRNSFPTSRPTASEVTLSALFTTDFFRLVYRPGHYLRKAITFCDAVACRLDTLRDISQFDVIFIYREVFPIGPR